MIFNRETILSVVWCLLLILPMCSSPLLANINTTASQNDMAMKDFVLAIESSNKRLKNYRKIKNGLSLIQTSEDKNGHTLKQTYSSENGGARLGIWKTIHQDENFNQSVDVSNDIFFESNNFNLESVQLIAETSTTWTFSIANMVSVDNEGELSNREMAEIDEAIAKNLYTEIIIDKQHQQIKGIKIYAQSSFSPSLMVTIEKFELRLDFGEAWPQGPIIRKNMTKHIIGKFGWFINIDELVTTKLTEIQRINIDEKD